MASHEYPSYVKRLLKRGADELVERGWLDGYEFVKTGDFHRVRFYRSVTPTPMQLELLDHNGGSDEGDEEETDLLAATWKVVCSRLPKLEGTRLLSIEEGTATVAAGGFRDWFTNRLSNKVLKELQQEVEDVTAILFVG